MTFEERLKQIEIEEQDAALAKLETSLGDNVDDTAAEPPPPSYVEEGAPVHCSECGNNTFREEHNAIMCSNCGHGPFCNYCWKVHIRDFHPLLVQPYEDATRGIRRRARFLNHYLIRTVVKPAGLALGLAALLAAAYFAYMKQDERQAANIPSPAVADTTTADPALGKAAVGLAANVPSAGPTANTPPVAIGTAAANAPGIELVSVTSPVSRNTEANLMVRTAPGAVCTIQVRYRSGPSRAGGLEPKIASESGLAAWHWRVRRQTTPGEWPIDVACAMNNQTSRLAASIVVTE